MKLMANSARFMVVEAQGHTRVMKALSAMNTEVSSGFQTFFTDGTLNSYILFCGTTIQFSICTVALRTLQAPRVKFLDKIHNFRSVFVGFYFHQWIPDTAEDWQSVQLACQKDIVLLLQLPSYI